LAAVIVTRRMRPDLQAGGLPVAVGYRACVASVPYFAPYFLIHISVTDMS
jgi:hypothetical protein